MARVTVEDCILKVPNRFKLVMTAAQRARELSVGAELTVDRDNDKNPVIALREIADGTVAVDDLENALVRGLQKHVDVDETAEEGDEFLAAEEALSDFAAMGLGGTAAADEAEAMDEGDEEDSLVVGFEDIEEPEPPEEADEPED